METVLRLREYVENPFYTREWLLEVTQSAMVLSFLFMSMLPITDRWHQKFEVFG